jgi:hypothetical protein
VFFFAGHSVAEAWDKRMNFVRAFKNIVVVVLAYASVSVGIADTPDTKKTLIPEVNILRGEFEQIRILKGFRNPLKSEGHFLVSKADGVVWQGVKPFPSLILVSNSGKITNLASAQKTVNQNGKKPNAAMSKIMLAMLSGDQNELAKYFIIKRNESNSVWTIQLQPKGGMARVFTRIEIKGDRYIHEVLMDEKSGDKTELHFSAVSEVPNTLTAEEKKYFQ